MSEHLVGEALRQERPQGPDVLDSPTSAFGAKKFAVCRYSAPQVLGVFDVIEGNRSLDTHEHSSPDEHPAIGQHKRVALPPNPVEAEGVQVLRQFESAGGAGHEHHGLASPEIDARR
jgi:hypothetical protein